ncbi:hypothetical protein WJX73_002629 [Symbiochloris irregularis]|uniref:Rho-GAP domain-containing protein n=1 Tax=Symbiochloris irregularis TaxID=706552 RepID=A0AAW1NV29_9CHLO
MSGYNALSDRDEYGEGGLLMDSEIDDVHHETRNRDSGNGHYVATASPSYGTTPAERSYSAGSAGLRSRGSGGSGLRKVANYLSEKTAQAKDSMAQRDWGPQEQDTAKHVKNWSGSTAARVSNSAQKGWMQAKEATVDGYRKVTGGALAGLCRAEASAQPCPRAVLVCCSALVCGGLATEGLFRRDVVVDADAVHWLLGGLQTGSGVVLPAAGASAHVIATALMRWLHTLEEPLLTYKLLPEFVTAGKDAPLRGTVIMKQLPVANLNALQVLLECWHRLATHFAINGMDARIIAENVVSGLAWHPPPPASKQQSYMALSSEGRPATLDSDDERGNDSDTDGAYGALGPRTSLNPMEREAMISVVERLIETFTHRVTQGDAGLYQGNTF